MGVYRKNFHFRLACVCTDKLLLSFSIGVYRKFSIFVLHGWVLKIQNLESTVYRWDPDPPLSGSPPPRTTHNGMSHNLGLQKLHRSGGSRIFFATFSNDSTFSEELVSARILDKMVRRSSGGREKGLSKWNSHISFHLRKDQDKTIEICSDSLLSFLSGFIKLQLPELYGTSLSWERYYRESVETEAITQNFYRFLVLSNQNLEPR